jgi:AcrR family transcriptional regulator
VAAAFTSVTIGKVTADALDPRVARTRRDVVDATSNLLLNGGWDAVTHAEVARRAGYSKATIYSHWPTRLDLIRMAIEHICDEAHHPTPTGDLRSDLRAALADFANDLREGHLDRLLAGVVERANESEIVQALRLRLYETGTQGMRTVLEAHLDAQDIEPSLALLTGSVFIRVTFEGKPATDGIIDDLIDRVLEATR